MALVLVLGFSSIAIADTPINTEDILVMSTSNPFEYGTAPNDICIVLYDGATPYLPADMDVSSCVVNGLYVYNTADNSVAEISNQSVSTYTATRSALYYVTQMLCVVK